MTSQGTVYTPHADACLHGITRGLIIGVCRDLSIPLQEKNLSLTEFYNADVVFATGTMGELTPVKEIDGRKIINRSSDKTLEKITAHFQTLIPKYSEKLN
jgi:branched-chain amino acid aminotransferase